MRPLRLLLSLSSCVLALTLLLYLSLPSASPGLTDSQHKGSLRALFSFSAPSLFPPSAIISLTDDNSTFFLARPAAFGPPLPSKGLSGQLWTGSGFGGDILGHGGLAAGAEGELGCSDVPGWSEGGGRASTGVQIDSTSRKSVKDAGGGPKAGAKAGHFRRATIGGNIHGPADSKTEIKAVDNDGTDDHLHNSVSEAWIARNKAQSLTKGGKEPPEHADIQSLQESAEIAGKVVLLSRGGCGFLEKVKWAQRRGGVAVIVGDDIRGGPLVTMYARGDTSNITIPALFTSHTTAHLLSSLIPSGGFVEGLTPENAAKLGLGDGSKTPKGSKSEKGSASRPTFTHAVSSPKSSSADQSRHKKPLKGSSMHSDEVHADVAKREHAGWIRSFLAIFGTNSRQDSTAGDASRPPSSGNIDWILVEDWEEEQMASSARTTRKGTAKAKHTPSSPTFNSMSKPSQDDFVIGVQDWRDPDLLPQQTKPTETEILNDKQSGKKSSGSSKPQGGNVLPGSGEYVDPESHPGKVKHQDASTEDKKHMGKGKGWLDNMPWSKHEQDDEDSSAKETKPTPRASSKPKASSDTSTSAPMSTRHTATGSIPNSPDRHDGLWVTLTPTSVSSSPFFDTLLVLVVSPLVTLTVVYALLILRSRIRRRRWRAPKSVVDRLPVRTYHTLASADSSASTSPIGTPNPAAASSRTPLLQGSSSTHASTSRSRPRSRTTSEVPSRGVSGQHDPSASPADEEKGEGGLAAWRRKYGGRQKECVVCLEEYVDGISRVMSLPCGHEFHAECITPWLTTRRRTCPICKGDVVRSLAQQPSPSPSPFSPGSIAAPSSASTSHHYDIVAPDEQAANAVNEDPTSARPLSISSSLYEEDDDLENGRERRGNEEDNESGISAWIRDGWNEVQEWWGGTSRSERREELDRNR